MKLDENKAGLATLLDFLLFFEGLNSSQKGLGWWYLRFEEDGEVLMVFLEGFWEKKKLDGGGGGCSQEGVFGADGKCF